MSEMTRKLSKSKVKSAKRIREEELRDPAIRAEYERLSVAHAVAMRVIRHRMRHRARLIR